MTAAISTIEALVLLEKETKADFNTEIYVTGGYVRDFMRKKRNLDIDVVVRFIPLEDVMAFLKKYGKTKLLRVSQMPGSDPVEFVSFVANGDTLEAQIAHTKGPVGRPKGTATLKQDSRHRDFTINAMYLPIGALRADRLIDYTGGKNDISARQLLTVGHAKKQFVRSPIRILRAFSLAARTGYTIADHVKHYISECAYLLKGIPPEPIKNELVEILMSSKPSVQLRLMAKLGVLKVILPELDVCFGCSQDEKYHKYDVFTHLIYTCDNSECDLVLRLAGLLHDIGKPPARMEGPDNRVTFHKHEVYGEKLAGVILKRLRFDNDTIDKVTHLVRMHMYHYTREWTDAGVRKFITSARITAEDLDNLENLPLFKLRRAERLGNGFKTQATTPRQLDFEKRIIDIYRSSTGFTVKDLAIDGTDLMTYFGMTPGKEIGEVLKYLLDVIIENPDANDRKQLLFLAFEFIFNKKEQK